MQIGLIVNPLAGLGGPLALQGSDGALAATALAMGGEPLAGQRAARALAGLEGITIRTAAGAMGADAARAAGHRPIIHHQPQSPSTPADTAAAARALCAAGIDLLLFAGGDGTARDLIGATADVPVLGIPAGVKMHSAVFATSPAAAAALLADLARGRPLRRHMAEIIDRDAGGTPMLHGLLPAPLDARRQAAKAAGGGAPDADLAAACTLLARDLADCPLAIVGTGATMLAVKQALAGTGTLLGVDAYAHGRLIASDADEQTLWSLVSQAEQARLVLGVIGGQGFLLGRGNQQLSARIVQKIGQPAITVMASTEKLASLPGGRLLVDSGSERIDQLLAGQIGVIIAPRRRMMMLVAPA